MYDAHYLLILSFKLETITEWDPISDSVANNKNRFTLTGFVIQKNSTGVNFKGGPHTSDDIRFTTIPTLFTSLLTHELKV